MEVYEYKLAKIVGDGYITVKICSHCHCPVVASEMTDHIEAMHPRVNTPAVSEPQDDLRLQVAKWSFKNNGYNGWDALTQASQSIFLDSADQLIALIMKSGKFAVILPAQKRPDMVIGGYEDETSKR